MKTTMTIRIEDTELTFTREDFYQRAIPSLSTLRPEAAQHISDVIPIQGPGFTSLSFGEIGESTWDEDTPEDVFVSRGRLSVRRLVTRRSKSAFSRKEILMTDGCLAYEIEGTWELVSDYR